MITLGAVASSPILNPSCFSGYGVVTGFPGDAEISEGGANIHDPTIVCFRDKYFCFSTCGDGFGIVRSSDDLFSWKLLGHILSETPSWLADRYSHRSVWAPDVVVDGDRVRLYYCASNFGTNQSVIGLAECERFNPDQPLEGWTDHGLVLESLKGRDFYNAIDPKVIWDGEKQWMFFGSYFAGIHVVEINPSTGKLVETPHSAPKCIAKNTKAPGNPIEAPTVCKRGEFYYLFVSYGLAAQGVRSSYQIMVGRSRSITGPYADRRGIAMVDGGHEPFLSSSFPMFAPGGSDVFEDGAGRCLMSYHFYDPRRFWAGGLWGMPTLQVRELVWSEDGWPFPGLPIEAMQPTARHENDSITGTWIHQHDFSEPKRVVFRQDGTVRYDDVIGTWSRQGSQLTLAWPAATSGGQGCAEQLQLEYCDTYYVGLDVDGRIVRGAKLPGGYSEP